MVRLLRWAFRKAEELGDEMISFGVCLARGGGCEPVPDGTGAEDMAHQHLGTMHCHGDLRCAHAYAMPKRRARRLSAAWANATAGVGCSRGLWGKGSVKGRACSADPFFVDRYFSTRCTLPGGACSMLLVGGALEGIGAKGPAKNHLGLFFQDHRQFGRTLTEHIQVPGQ